MKKTVSTSNLNISRGQLYFADLEPTVGSEQGGVRPVLIVQNEMGNRHSPTTIVAPITSKTKKSLPTHLSIPNHPEIEDGAVILLEQLRTIDKSRLGKHIGCLERELLHRVDGGLAVSLGLFQRVGEPLIMTLCRSCAGHYRDTRIYVLQRINFKQCIKEPCLLCTMPGFDYAVTRRS